MTKHELDIMRRQLQADIDDVRDTTCNKEERDKLLLDLEVRMICLKDLRRMPTDVDTIVNENLTSFLA